MRKKYTIVVSTLKREEKKIFVLQDKSFAEAASWSYQKCHELMGSTGVNWYICSISDDCDIDPSKAISQSIKTAKGVISIRSGLTHREARGKRCLNKLTQSKETTE